MQIICVAQMSMLRLTINATTCIYTAVREGRRLTEGRRLCLVKYWSIDFTGQWLGWPTGTWKMYPPRCVSEGRYVAYSTNGSADCMRVGIKSQRLMSNKWSSYQEGAAQGGAAPGGGSPERGSTVTVGGKTMDCHSLLNSLAKTFVNNYIPVIQ